MGRVADKIKEVGGDVVGGVINTTFTMLNDAKVQRLFECFESFDL